MAKKKKKRVIKVKNLIILLGILCLTIGLFYYAITMPIKNIYIEGNQIISDDEIIKKSQLYDYPSFLLSNISQLKNSLKKHEFIKKTKVEKKLGNIIQITITEYQPIAITTEGNILLANGKTLENIYELNDIPIMINTIDKEEIKNNFAKKFGQVNTNILRQISQVEYSPVSVDEDRFLLYMNDGNLVYITLTKIYKLNKYNQIKAQLEGKTGKIYLDSGNYIELKKDVSITNSNLYSPTTNQT